MGTREDNETRKELIHMLETDIEDMQARIANSREAQTLIDFLFGVIPPQTFDANRVRCCAGYNEIEVYVKYNINLARSILQSIREYYERTKPSLKSGPLPTVTGDVRLDWYFRRPDGTKITVAYIDTVDNFDKRLMPSKNCTFRTEETTSTFRRLVLDCPTEKDDAI